MLTSFCMNFNRKIEASATHDRITALFCGISQRLITIHVASELSVELSGGTPLVPSMLADPIYQKENGAD